MFDALIGIFLSPLLVTLAIVVALAAGSWLFYDKYNDRHGKKRGETPPKIPSKYPEGQVPLLDSKFYVERPPIEKECYTKIKKENALIRIKAPRQMGKSSLITRILHHAETKLQAITIKLDLQQNADEATVQDLDKLLQWFTGRIAKKLQLDFNVNEHWNNVFSSINCCENYFEQHILPHLKAPVLVIALDEVDRVFQYDGVAKDFFGMLRAWHEPNKNRPNWQKLRLILAHAQEVYIQLNINQSPFNVGLGVELTPFNFEQSKDLMSRYELKWSDNDLKKLRKLVGGHPHLLRLAFYHIAEGKLSLAELLKSATSYDGVYHEHLYRHSCHLQKYNLASEMRQIIMSDHPTSVTPQVHFKLRSLGLVRWVDNNKVEPSCDLYRQYFQNTLVSS